MTRDRGNMDLEQLCLKTKTELRALCLKHGLSTDGTKKLLAAAICAHESSHKPGAVLITYTNHAAADSCMYSIRRSVAEDGAVVMDLTMDDVCDIWDEMKKE